MDKSLHNGMWLHAAGQKAMTDEIAWCPDFEVAESKVLAVLQSKLKRQQELMEKAMPTRIEQSLDLGVTEGIAGIISLDPVSHVLTITGDAVTIDRIKQQLAALPADSSGKFDGIYRGYMVDLKVKSNLCLMQGGIPKGDMAFLFSETSREAQDRSWRERIDLFNNHPNFIVDDLKAEDKVGKQQKVKPTMQDRLEESKQARKEMQRRGGWWSRLKV